MGCGGGCTKHTVEPNHGLEIEPRSDDEWRWRADVRGVRDCQVHLELPARGVYAPACLRHGSGWAAATLARRAWRRGGRAARQHVQVLIDTDGRAGRGELDTDAPSLGPRPRRVRQGAAAAEGGCLDEGERFRSQLLVEGEELYQCSRERRRGARGVRTGREPP